MECEFDAPVLALNLYVAGNDVNFDVTLEEIEKFLTVLNKHLRGRKFIVGEGMTIADLAIAATVGPVLATLYGADERKKFSNLTAWFLQLALDRKEI